MTRTTLRFLLPTALAIPLAAAAFGGWNTISLNDVPDYLRARQPTQLTFTVRQHGVEGQSNLKPSVEARSGDVTTSVNATPGRRAGEYSAALTLPSAGEWTLTLNSNWHDMRNTLLPIRVVDAGAPAPAVLAEAERGRRLFVAKACSTCHVHAAVGGKSFSVGPDLTGRTFPADYLAQFLADPSIKKPTSRNKMPNLELKPAEIAALVTFINTERQAMR